MKAITLSPDGKYLAAVISYSNQYTVIKWEVRSGREVMNIPIKDIHVMDEQYFNIAFSDQQQIYVTTHNNTEFRTLEVTPKRLLLRSVIPKTQDLTSHEKIAFSANGQYLALVEGNEGQNPQITVWKTTTGHKVNQFPLPKNLSIVASLAVSYDGNYVATSDVSNLTRLRIWQPSTGQEISQIQVDNGVRKAWFSQKRLFIEVHKSLGVWLWQPQDLIDEVCDRLSRNLTEYEWQQYLRTESYRQTCPGLPTPNSAEDERSQA